MARTYNKSTLISTRYEPKCSICKLSKNNRTFLKRLKASKRFNPTEKTAESLSTIAKAYKVHLNRISYHISHHMTVNPEDMTTLQLENIAKREEAKMAVREVEEKAKVTEVWDEVIEAAREGLKDGSIKITANHLLKAAKDKSDFSLKKKDQDLKIQEMMWHFASGEALGSDRYDRRVIEGETAEAYDPASIFAGAIDEGSPRPSDIHPGATGDATTPGSDQVLEGDDF